MKADFFYSGAAGRLLLRGIQKTGALKLAARLLHTGLSRPMISRCIARHEIDMTDFAGQQYGSFAEFFARKKDSPLPAADPGVLISPCDGLFSAYPIEETTELPIKGSVYRVADLLPKEEHAARFAGGLCLIFRLEAKDYHHFCCFDDCELTETGFLPGLLHSVQPIACRSVPVYRLNRRWWTLMDTKHFGPAAQIEVGAMLVGGVSLVRERGPLSRGDEMGHFELAGSTIVLLLSADARARLRMFPGFGGEEEVRVAMGQGVGRIEP